FALFAMPFSVGFLTLVASFMSDALRGARYLQSRDDAMKVGQFPWALSRFSGKGRSIIWFWPTRAREEFYWAVSRFEFNREAEFNLSQKGELRSLAVQNAANRLATMRLINGFLDRLRARRNGAPFRSPECAKPLSDKHKLAQEVVDTYLSN